MFVFHGSLKEKIIQQANKRISLRYFIVIQPFVSLGLIVSIILGVFNVPGFIEILSLTILLFLISLLAFTPAKSIIHRIPQKIIFDLTKNTISINSEEVNNFIKPKTKQISKIKKILDYGEWFLITFKGDITDKIICQKDLLVNGTLEEFEQYFKTKLFIKNK